MAEEDWYLDHISLPLTLSHTKRDSIYHTHTHEHMHPLSRNQRDTHIPTHIEHTTSENGNRQENITGDALTHTHISSIRREPSSNQ